ncbi:MAG TPA: class I SAM-dependent methyltransferase [Pseudonocardiaceae bacterium]|nr:class I SAM-dependent methyltransferase [Pseudonocardiaceae bacterium]
MLERVRRSAVVAQFRRNLRDKAAQLVDEVVSRHYRQQAEQIEELRREVARLVGQAADRVVEHTSAIEIRARRDVIAAGEADAAREAAAFIRDHMASARHFGHPHTTLEHALSLAPAGGMALEFGVYTGTTLKIIATARQGERVFGFDSFQGLPETWRSDFPTGTFAVPEPPDVPGAELVVGWFSDTLPGFLDTHPGPVDFLHVDADLYSAADTVLTLVGPRLHAGSVVVFDEYFNYPGWQRHEHQAWQEYVGRTGTTFSYEAYTYDHEQVVVRVTGP